MTKIIILTLAVLFLTDTIDQDALLAMAIYQAEGGSAAKYPFGIRSVRCVGYTQCKERCQATIRHNRRRFAQVACQGHQSFIEYLADRYCPGQGRKNAAREHASWLKNVKSILRKELNHA